MPADLKLPADLASRKLPAQSAGVEGPALLKAAQLPTRKDRVWTIELAPLTRMDAWKVPEIKVGDSVGVLGFTFAGEKGDAVLRAEYLFVGGRPTGALQPGLTLSRAALRRQPPRWRRCRRHGAPR
ncbi:MAG: hypothetical protein U1F50_17875 [Rubrivivax sp.]